MFNLKLDIKEEEYNEKQVDTLDKLPKELHGLIKEIRNKSKNNTCTTLKNDGSGQFGTVEISKSNVKKILELINERDIPKLLEGYRGRRNKSQLHFLINRLNNYCNDIKKYVRIAKKHFPKNFVDIYKCNLCNFDNKKNQIYVEMGIGKGETFKKFLKNKNISKKEIYSVIIQIYYISIVLNLKKLYHNDLKPANIIISKTKKTFVYTSMSSGDRILKMTVQKGSYYPVIIDYDLCSFKTPQTVEVEAIISEIVPDYSFFNETTIKVDKSLSTFLNKLPEYDTRKEYKNKLKNIYDSIKDNKVLKPTFN